eukprot:GHVS01096263.1.p1 GENE.GHVS01096263.1~~GHVS01096263.1.p1  ORF type:complete len:466 (+),score=100.58 GHVS01096263.1:40-1398(+)
MCAPCGTYSQAGLHAMFPYNRLNRPPPSYTQPQPSREANLRHTISAVSRLLSSRPPPPTVRPTKPALPKLTAPVALPPPPSLSNRDTSSTTSSPFVAPSPVDLKISPISSSSSSPSLSASSRTYASTSTIFSLPRLAASANSSRVSVLQRRIVRLQMAVKVCEARRTRRRQFLAHTQSCKNWHSLRNVPPPKRTSPTKTKTAARQQAQVEGGGHRNLTLVNYPRMYGRHLSLSIGRISASRQSTMKASSSEQQQTEELKTLGARREHARLKTLTFCKFYNITGHCRRGDECPFYHDPYRSLRHPPQSSVDETSLDSWKLGPGVGKHLFVLSDEKNHQSSVKRTRGGHEGSSVKEDDTKRVKIQSIVRYHQPEDGSSEDSPVELPASPAEPPASSVANIGGWCEISFEGDSSQPAEVVEEGKEVVRDTTRRGCLRYFNMVEDEDEEDIDSVAD